MSVDVHQLSLSLSEIIEKMLSSTRVLEDETTAFSLERQAASLKRGLVRVAFLGSTSSGKSTIINALLGQFAMPENPSVSSPVPVWIHYHEKDQGQVEVLRRENGRDTVSQIDMDTFMTRYCYNISDITNPERIRFRNVVDASVALNSDILSGGAVLIDTLGIAASAVDTAKTLAVLNEGVDLVVFVTRNPQLQKNEVDFLREYVLGYEPEKHRVNYPVDPQNLILVLNEFLDKPRVRTFLETSTENLFLGTDAMSPEAHAQWVKTNIFDIQGLFARMMRCGKPYPYDRLTPEGSTEKTKKELVGRMQRENMLLNKLLRMDYDVQLSGIGELQEGLAHHILRRSVGQGSVSFTRIYSLLTLLTQIRSAANNRLQTVMIGQSNLQALRENIQNLHKHTDEDIRVLTHALTRLKEDYVSSFNELFHARFAENGTAWNSCMGRVLQTEMPEEFEDFHLGDFQKLSDQEKIARLTPYIDQTVETIFAFCRDDVLKQLDETRNFGNGKPTPYDVLEESRCYMKDQAEALNTRIAAIEKLGLAEQLGVMLPAKQEVEAFLISLQTDLEKKLLEAISDALSGGLDKFNAKRSKFMQKVSGNFFTRILLGLKGPRSVWKRLCEEYFKPLVGYSLEALGDFCHPKAAAGLSSAVNAAYTNALVEIVKKREGIVFTLESALARADLQISAGDAQAQKLKEQMQAILDSCDALETELRRYQADLLAD